MSKTVLITGANGFIGKNLVKYIMGNTSWNVIALDKTQKDDLGDGGGRYKDYCVDLLNKNDFSKIVEPFDYVVHLAAQKDVSGSYADIGPYITTNVLGTANLLDWLRTKPFDKMINFSTAAVIGANKLIVDENAKYDPMNPYAGTKAAQELICISYANTFQLPIVNVRIDTPFGPCQPEKNLVPTIINNMINNQPIKFYGKDVPFSNEFCSRNWVYVDVISKNIINILINETKKAIEKFPIHIVGYTCSIPYMFGMIKQFIDTTYSKFEWFLVDEKSHVSDQHLKYDLRSFYSNEQPIEQFKESIKETVEWYKNHYIKN